MRDVLTTWRPAIDEAISEVLPREVDESYLDAFFGEPTFSYDAEAIQAGLADPVWDLLDRGGKRWRSVLFLVLVDAFGEPPEEYLRYACVPEILHTGTIIVDDVEDEAELRRGEPALHRIYGQDVALNAGNALYFIPLKLITGPSSDLDAERQLAAYRMLTYELNRTHLGQGMDIDWHNRRRSEVSEAEYLEMCACKTGCLARITARLAAIVTDQSEPVERAVATYAERMSVGFQIIDDVLDVENSLGEAGDFGKAFGNDIREGKTTLMVIHALSSASPERAERLQAVLADPDPSDEDVLAAIEVIQATGAVEHSRERALELAREAREAIEPLSLDPEPAETLADFPGFMIERQH